MCSAGILGDYFDERPVVFIGRKTEERIEGYMRDRKSCWHGNIARRCRSTVSGSFVL